MDKYQYLTGENLGLKPSIADPARFEYSPLGKISNKGLSEDDKKEVLLKRLKKTEGKNEVQLQAIKDQGEKQLRENINKSNTLKVIDEIRRKNADANKILLDIKKIDETLDDAELVCTKTDGTKYDFNRFLSSLKFIEKIHNYEITLHEAKNDQTELGILINKLNNNYNPKIQKKVKEKNDVLKSARKVLQENCLLVFLKKEFFSIKVMYLKQKKKNQKKRESTNLSNILKMNKRL